MFRCKDRSEGTERATQQKAEISRCAPGALGLDHPLAREERLRDEESGDEDPSIASLRKRTGIRDDEEAGEELHREGYRECLHFVSFLLAEYQSGGLPISPGLHHAELPRLTRSRALCFFPQLLQLRL